MLSTTSKFMLLFLFNIFLLFTITPAGWLAHKPASITNNKTQSDDLQKYKINQIPRVNPHQKSKLQTIA